MRISDDRYSRDRLRLDLALRFMRHEARTHTIRKWTGLTDDRIRKLYRSYLDAPAEPVARHRGKSPGQAGFFTRTPRAQQEAAILASLFCLLGVMPCDVVVDAENPLPGVARGERLCQAYEAYLHARAQFADHLRARGAAGERARARRGTQTRRLRGMWRPRRGG